MNGIYNWIKFCFASIIWCFCYILGGFDVIIKCLLIAMVIDYISGVMVAISNKTLSSKVGYKGIIKKTGILLVVAISYLVEMTTEIKGIRDLVASFYITNESISCLENYAGIGLPMPEKLKMILQQIKEKK